MNSERKGKDHRSSFPVLRMSSITDSVRQLNNKTPTFLTSPLFPVSPRSHSKCVRSRPLRSCQHTMTSSTFSYPKPVPSIASAIQDPSARHMLSSLRYTPIETPLCQPIIHTSHVVVSAQAESTSSPKPPPALVFLHGFDSNLLEYRFMLPLMKSAHVDAHYFDLLGWGLTERPVSPTFHYGPTERRLHLRSYIDQLLHPDQPVFIVGASIGGAVAVDYALNSDRRVDGLILINAQVFADRPKSAFSNIPGVASLGAKVLRSDWLRRIAINLSYHSPSFKHDDILRIGGLHCTLPGWTEATEDMLRNEGYCLKKYMHQVELPTLVLWGQHDRVLPKQDAPMFQETIRNCHFQYIEESGHSPHIENPTVVADAILEFVDNVAKSSSWPSSPIF